MGKRRPPDNTICRNRKACFRFHILEEIECGILLLGTEVKSLRARDASLEESYARIEDNELWLIKCHISAYKSSHTQDHDPIRRRKLLVHARELAKLRPKVEQRGLTLVPLRLYFNDRGLAKVTLGLARGKAAWDKRQAIKAREHKREMERAIRRHH